MVDTSRRSFLKGLAVASVGSVVASLRVEPVVAQEEQGAPELPWPYVELDPEYVRKLGHLGYYSFECGGGSFWAIMTALKEQVGYPYTLLPLPDREEVLSALEEKRHLHGMMQYGYGGGVAWGTLCGALNGSISAVTMVSENWDKIGKALMRWYEITPFPSDTSNSYASGHQFLVPKYKSDKVLPQNVSGSVLCHVSVGKWCEISGYASGSAERSERCARLTGDVAAKAVELLNADLRGALEEAIAGITLSQTTAECRTCHYKGKDYEGGQFTRGFLQCETCHKDMRPHVAEARLQTAYGTPLNTWAGFLTGAAVGGVAIHLIKRAVGGGHGGEE